MTNIHKPQVALFVDVDRNQLYDYSNPHFQIIREKGMLCLTIAQSNRHDIKHLQQNTDKLFLIDQINVDSLLELIRSLQDQYEIKLIFCHAGHPSESGFVGCIVANVCKILELPYSSTESINYCNNKFLMRQILQQHNVSSVPSALCSDVLSIKKFADEHGFPLFFKPPFGALSSFAKCCNNLKELITHYELFIQNYLDSRVSDFYGYEHDIVINKQFVHRYIPGKTILLEKYIDGIEGSLECIITADKIYPVIVQEKLLISEQKHTTLEHILITPPHSFSSEEIKIIKQYAVECLKAIGLKHAVIHFEFKMTQNGPIVIEINPRLGGIYVNSAFRDIAKINPYEIYIEMLLGNNTRANELADKACDLAIKSKQFYSMAAVYPEYTGYFNGINNLTYLKDIPEVVEFNQHLPTPVNAEIEENYLLKYWAKVDSADQANSIYQDILKNCPLDISKNII